MLYFYQELLTKNQLISLKNRSSPQHEGKVVRQPGDEILLKYNSESIGSWWFLFRFQCLSPNNICWRVKIGKYPWLVQLTLSSNATIASHLLATLPFRVARGWRRTVSLPKMAYLSSSYILLPSDHVSSTPGTFVTLHCGGGYHCWQSNKSLYSRPQKEKGRKFGLYK